MRVSAAQLQIDRGTVGAVYATLKDFLNRKVVDQLPFVSTQTLTFSGTNNAKIDSSILAGNLAIGSNTAQNNGGIVAAVISGAFSTGSTETVTNTQGLIINKVEVRDSATNDPITDTDGRRIYGLIQAASGTGDGDAIAASGSENTRLTLIKYDSTDTIVTVTYTGSIEFRINKIYSELFVPALRLNGGSIDMDIIQQHAQLIRKLLVTSTFVPNEVINLTTGVGSGSGAATGSGAAITLPTSGSAFNTEGKLTIYRNGVLQDKGTGNDVIWDSTNSLHFTDTIEAGEIIHIYAPSGY